MPIAIHNVRSVIGAIDAALVSGRLDDWQTRFLTDIRAKLDRYGSKTRLSNKQVTKLQEIIAPFQQPTGNVQNTQTRRAEVRPWSRTQKLRRQYRQKSRSNNRSGVGYIIPFLALGAAMVIVAHYVASIWLEGSSEQNSGLYERQLSRSDFSITDGDTIKIVGERKGTRLVGFNTPETFEPRCEKGLMLGKQATNRLRELVANAESIEIEKFACSCRPGTEGTKRCNYGRSCGIFRVDGKDVGPILIAEGLAAPFKCGATNCPPTPRPWCR